MKELVLGLAGKLAGHVAQLGGVVDVVLQHVAQHGNGFFPAVGVVMPELAGRINGMSVRVPTFDCSLVDLTCEVEKPCDAAAVNAALKAASQGALRENMGFSEEPLVSIDYRGSTYGGVVDALSTQVLQDTMVKLLIWYDNESGFTNQLLRLVRMVGRSL